VIVAAICLVALVVVAVLLVVSLAELHRAEQPMSGDWCRECLTDLRRGSVYEVRTDHIAADDGQGGTFMSATYCRKHAPAGAIRH